MCLRVGSRCHGAGRLGNSTGGWWDLGEGRDSDSGKDHLLSHGSSPKSKPSCWAGSPRCACGRRVCVPVADLRTGSVAHRLLLSDVWGRRHLGGLCPDRAPAVSSPWLAGTESGLWFTDAGVGPDETSDWSEAARGQQDVGRDAHPSWSRPRAQPAQAGKGREGGGWDLGTMAGGLRGEPAAGRTRAARGPVSCWALPSCYG